MCLPFQSCRSRRDAASSCSSSLGTTNDPEKGGMFSEERIKVAQLNVRPRASLYTERAGGRRRICFFFFLSSVMQGSKMYRPRKSGKYLACSSCIELVCWSSALIRGKRRARYHQARTPNCDCSLDKQRSMTVPQETGNDSE